MQEGGLGSYNKKVITLFFSEQPRLCQEMSKRFLKDDYPVRDETNFASFNMQMTSIGELVKECTEMSLFAEKKAVVAEDCFFLKKGKAKLRPDDSLDPLVEYCQNPNPLVDLVLLYYGSDLDPKNPIVKRISEIGSVKEIKNPTEQELVAFAKRRMEARGCPFESGAAEELSQRTEGDYSRFLNELDKLENYGNGEPITLKAVKALVSPKPEDDVFQMTNALMRGDIQTAFCIYKDLKKGSGDEIGLLALLTQQFIFLDKVAYLDEKGFGVNQIASSLNAKPFRVSMGIRSLGGSSRERVEEVLESLYQTVQSILSGKQQQGYAFERFLANYSLRK